MSGGQFHLLKTKRFLPLFLTQFLGAFNDNTFKNALASMITFSIISHNVANPQIMVTLSLGILILPFFLFSATAGQLADSTEKSLLIKRIKLFEVIIMTLAMIGFYLQNIYLLFATLFLMGTQSTFFSPLKFSILPTHLRDDELLGGNGLIEMGTFVSILLGTIVGTLFVVQDNGVFIIACMVLSFAVLGWLSSQYIPLAPAASPGLKINPNFVSETWKMLAHTKSRPDIFLCMLGISWLWFFGATYLAQFHNYSRFTLGGDEKVTTLFLATFTVGVAIGSLLCNKILKGKISAQYAPLAALGMTVFAVDLYFASNAAGSRNSDELIGAIQFLSKPAHWRILIDLTLIAISAGIYIVPLYSIIQSRSAKEHLSRNIAALNILNALFMVVSSLGGAILLAQGLTVPQIFLTVAIMNGFVAIYICKLLPREVVKVILRHLFRLFYKVEVRGLEHYEKVSGKAVIVINHISFLDGLLLGAFLPDTPTAAMNTFIAKRWWVKPALALFDIVTVDPSNPMSIKTMVKTVKDNNKLMIFPEGRITVTGALMKVYEGPGTIAHLADAPLIPVRIDGAQYTIFSRVRDKLPTHFSPKITIDILPATRFMLPEGVRGQQRRRLIGAQLYDIMSDMIFSTSNLDQTVFETLLSAKNTFGARTAILEDIERQPIHYRRLLTASFILGNHFKKITDTQENVAILLPNAVGTVATLFGLQATNRVPAMLNYSTGLKNMQSACETALIKTIITSQRFIKLAKLQDCIDALAQQFNIVYLEDVKASISLYDKLKGLLASYTPRHYYKKNASNVSADDASIILFTSGSEGVPKGVVLSHKNILANRYQLSSRIDFNPTDTVFNALPVFHSFGLTGGLLLPLLSGIKSFLYPSPLHYRIVPELIYDTNSTIMFGTDTFLTGYARKAHPYDFYSIRYIFAGAEKVKAETRAIYADKFGIRILEGYGATETAPALAANTPMHYKANTVGRLLPGIEYRLESIPGITTGGRLLVSGPNIMKGYYLHNNAGQLQPPESGWYDTGDIVEIDPDGFITITGRAKRFAKIAGEMVSLTAVETVISTLWPEQAHAVVSIPDARKGEQLVLSTTQPTAERKQIAEYAQQQGIAEIMVPRQILIVDKIPVLGTGKTDYVSLQQQVDQKFIK